MKSKVTWKYEPGRIPYISHHTYTPDIILPAPPNMKAVFEHPERYIIIEIKGRLTRANRQKHKNIKEQHPNLDIRFLLQNPNNRLEYGSNRTQMTQAIWCTRNGFQWAGGTEIPEAWIMEALSKKK